MFNKDEAVYAWHIEKYNNGKFVIRSMCYINPKTNKVTYNKYNDDYKDVFQLDEEYIELANGDRKEIVSDRNNKDSYHYLYVE